MAICPHIPATVSSPSDSFPAGTGPAFDVVVPAVWCRPLILNSPHSGRNIPRNLLQRSCLAETELRRSEDSYIDELFESCVAFGIPLLKALVSRSYVDLNREPHELDPRMFSDKLPGFANTSTPRVLSGLGTIPRTVSDGHDIYRTKLLVSEAMARIDEIYLPYHRTLSALLNEAYVKTGFVLLLDCHSMPLSAVTDSGAKGGTVDVILGDRFGTSADPELVGTLEGLFISQGLKVRRNRPYAGGFITETHGNPRINRHAIQIELNRSVYMNEQTLEKKEGFIQLARALKQIISGLVTYLDKSGWFTTCKLAAE
jgi:N-formylglutamate amidohydrolase